METPLIRDHANRRFEQVSAMKQSMHDLKRELRAAKVEQKIHRTRSLRVIVEASMDPSQPHVAEAIRHVNQTRQVTQRAKQHEQHLGRLDHKIRSAMDDAHVLIDLARRASGGRIYAKHQADIMLNVNR